MQTLTFEEIKNKYWQRIEDFCFCILQNKSEAVINAANVFTTFQKMMADGFFYKKKNQKNVKFALLLLARTRCIQRLQWLRYKEELKPKNAFVLFFDRLIKKIKICLRII